MKTPKVSLKYENLKKEIELYIDTHLRREFEDETIEKEYFFEIVEKTEARLKNLEDSLSYLPEKKKREGLYLNYLKGSAMLCCYFEDYLKKKGKSVFEGYCLSNILLKDSGFNKAELEIILDDMINFSKLGIEKNNL
jgi:hypothetical protein